MEQNLAVLIDFENIAAGTEKDGLGRFDIELVLQRLSDKGRVLIARSYADWGRFARFKQGLLKSNVSMMELTSHGMQDKNRADIALVVEGMELAFTKPYIDTYVVVSGDSDFTPMVLKLRELDKRVIGCGCRSSTSRLLIQACDEFIFYDNLVKRKQSRQSSRNAPSRNSGSRTSSEMSLDDGFDLLVDTLEGLQRENPDPPHASVIKSAILRKSPDFNEGDLGFSSFARFLDKARKAGKINMIRDEKSGGYRVDVMGTGDDDGGSNGGRRGGNGRRRSESETWLDPYLPEGTEAYVSALAAEGLNPLSAPTRKAILQGLEEQVAYRKSKKRRITVQFVQEDVRRQLRKNHPDLPPRGFRHVFNALMRAGAFIHRDGRPVRTGSAPFELQKSAEQLNDTLTDIYVYELVEAGLPLDVAKMADLFFGNPSRTRPIEESIAYHQANKAETDDESAANIDDVDALLVEEGAGDEAAEPAAAKAPSEKKASAKKASAKKATTKKKTTAKKAADADDDGLDALLDTDDDEPPAKKTAKKSAAKKTTAKKATAKKATAKKATAKKATAKKATTKKATAKKASASDDTDSDDIAKAADEPETKKKAVRRKRTRKKVEDKPATDDLDDLLSES